MNENTRINFKHFRFEAFTFKSKEDRSNFQKFADLCMAGPSECCLTPILNKKGELISFIVDTQKGGG
jgi:hypothetical protein